MRPLALVRQTASEAAGQLCQACKPRLNKSHFYFAKQGNQGRAKTTAKITARRETIRDRVPWKNLLRRLNCRIRRLPDNSFFVLWSWRRDSNPRPSDYKSDALPTELRQQTPGESARLRASLSLGSLPDVRDNYIKYHTGKFWRNKAFRPTLPNAIILMLTAIHAN